MKSLGRFTVRGQLLETDGAHQIRLFDGKYKTAYKIVEFTVFGATANASANPDVMGKLATTGNLSTGSVNFFNAADTRELAWSGSAGSSDTMFNSPVARVLDPDNLVVEDLYIYARSSGTEPINYLIVLEKLDVGLTQGMYTLVQNNSQNFPQN